MLNFLPGPLLGLIAFLLLLVNILLWVPLLLACIVTMTPGTLSAELAPDRKHLLIHAFNADDEAALIATIQSRYETPLMEIFT